MNDTGVGFNSRNNFANLGSFAKVSVPLQFVIPWCVEAQLKLAHLFILGPGGTPRPIELYSHDPLRYVGDILAWLHQACASEHEHIASLLRLCQKEGIQAKYVI